MPSSRPLATDGAAPSTITNRIAASPLDVSPPPAWKITIASGVHATDGIVCRPVIIEPIARRTTLNRAVTTPTAVPMTAATTKPFTPRNSVVNVALESVPS